MSPPPDVLGWLAVCLCASSVTVSDSVCFRLYTVMLIVWLGYCLVGKGKGKFHPITCHVRTNGE